MAECDVDKPHDKCQGCWQTCGATAGRTICVEDYELWAEVTEDLAENTCSLGIDEGNWRLLCPAECIILICLFQSCRGTHDYLHM